MEQKKKLAGLSDQQVVESRNTYGQNILTPPKKEPLWKQFLEKFKDPIIFILLIALLASFGVSCYHYWAEDAGYSVFLEPLGILLAVILATVVGFLFELNANKKFEMLNQVNDDTAVKVIRNGNVCEIPKKDVVVGDIVRINSGEEVPADGKLLEAVSLQINESTLTGEPVIKKTTSEAEFDDEATYPSDSVYKGTTVVDGHGIYEVTSVGDATEYGKVYEGSQLDTNVETPLKMQLDKLARLITKVGYSIAAFIVVTRLLYFFTSNDTFDWVTAGGFILNTVMIAVTVIVVAVPEGLPMSVTLSLALSMRRMLSTNNLVRQMHATETMGAATVICTDKTGTLTQNQMNVYQSDFYALAGQTLSDSDISKKIIEGIASNSTAFLDFSDKSKIKTIGNPTEAALLLWLNGQNVNYLDVREDSPIVDQLTFSTERKYMATVVESSLLNKKILYVKGAPEIVFQLSKRVETENGFESVSDYQPIIEKKLADYQDQAMRTLGFAYQILENNEKVIAEGKLVNTDLTFVGIVAISDPVRPDVPDAVKSCMSAGIDVKIVTGDTPATAREIGRQIGLWTESDTTLNEITGAEFAALSDKELQDRVLDLKIISRARPMDKKRLVELLQQKGQVVAVTGDGTNDAPALNAAQVGLSMGDGTQVAKEASAITILDNSFNSITRAVMWGRSLYKNIQRFIVFQMTINVAACLIVLLGSFLGTESPLTVTQMLWVNLIMDTFAALALASLPPSDSVMSERPRNNAENIISKPMAKAILGVGLFFVFLLFGLVQYFKHVDLQSLTDLSLSGFFSNYFNFTHVENGLSPYELALFFTIFVLLQFWNMFNAKAFGTGKSAFSGFGSLTSQGFGLIALVILVGQIIIVQFGGEMFSVVPISLIDWLIIIASTSVVLWVGELFRLVRKKQQ
ncbi:MAG: calcium-translocating P-type ATPase, PMCA-type [Bacteroidetes bacterium]|nr:calcium-translocating P-type ATPase, PMCA-type [Bacteroidota bacterium]